MFESGDSARARARADSGSIRRLPGWRRRAAGTTRLPWLAEEHSMETRIMADADTVAAEAARLVAAEARAAVAARGRFVVAFSGGQAPWQMLRLLSGEDLPWAAVHVLQVDERVAPAGGHDRNLTHLQQSLSRAPLPAANLHAMPVEDADLHAAAGRYARTLEQVAGTPPVLDLLHLGLGPDGHTASLVPGDPVLEVNDRDVATTGVYQNRRRMTLTFPALDRARRILWLVTGAGKAPVLPRLLAADRSIPAGRVRQDTALLLAEVAAAAQCPAGGA
jgi:6-phosphogluconolactonase